MISRKQWEKLDDFRAVDLALADFVQQRLGAGEPLGLAVALASRALGEGHTFVDLARWHAAQPDLAGALPLADWLALLQVSEAVATTACDAPLVLEDGRLYLARQWQAEESVAYRLRQLLQQPASELPLESAGWLRELFPQASAGPDWQMAACTLAAHRRLAIITGGPGTGKTTTVIRLLALLQRIAQPSSLRIRLAAPTGKAAARLSESISGKLLELPMGFSGGVPSEVVTLHRLLGSGVRGKRFAHHADNPLHADVVVVDEASMIDLEMMQALLDALPQHARLILLGDKDQLASVEAGSVLGELCRDAAVPAYDADTLEVLGRLTGQDFSSFASAGDVLAQHTVMLRHSHRFGADSRIGQLASAINAGDSDAVADLCRQPHEQLSLAPASALLPALGEGLAEYLRQVRQVPADPMEQDAHAARVLQALSSFQVLCAVRDGPHGVVAVNRQIVTALMRQELLPVSSELWFAGRPVMMTRNDYSLDIMNGDIGVVLPVQGGLRVAFSVGGCIRWVLPGRLEGAETAFAMTIHKSQGSEFDTACVLLPDAADSPVLTRELLYTAVTRARQRVMLIATTDVLQQTVARQVERASALRDKLVTGDMPID